MGGHIHRQSEGAPGRNREEREMAMAGLETSSCSRGTTAIDSFLPTTSSSAHSSVIRRVAFSGGLGGFGRRATAVVSRASKSVSCVQQKTKKTGGGDCLLSSKFLASFVGGSLRGAVAGQGLFQLSKGLHEHSSSPRSGARRGVVTMVREFSPALNCEIFSQIAGTRAVCVSRQTN